jgi:hypothetical protein
MFGRVKLVQDTASPDDTTYALKILQKAQIVSYQQQKNVVQVNTQRDKRANRHMLGQPAS